MIQARRRRRTRCALCRGRRYAVRQQSSPPEVAVSPAWSCPSCVAEACRLKAVPAFCFALVPRPPARASRPVPCVLPCSQPGMSPGEQGKGVSQAPETTGRDGPARSGMLRLGEQLFLPFQGLRWAHCHADVLSCVSRPAAKMLPVLLCSHAAPARRAQLHVKFMRLLLHVLPAVCVLCW